MKVVCISDTHGKLDRVKVPDGDILLHAGDATMMGQPGEILKFLADLTALPHKHKIVIAGNHDWNAWLNPKKYRKQLADIGATYLQDQEVTVEGLRVYGSPWQPEFFNWAFNVPRGKPLADKWAMIPAGLDFLVTHGPPKGILDRCPDGFQAGCEELLAAVLAKKPRYHVFGHIHDDYGYMAIPDTGFVNASICNEQYRPDNAPFVLEI